MTLRHTSLLILLMACGFLVVGQLYVTIPLVAGLASRFAIEPAAASLTGSAFGFAYAAGFILFGSFSDRYGRKPVILIGLVAIAATTLMAGLADSFGLLLMTRAMQGLAASLFPPAALSLVAEELPLEQRALGVSLMSFAFLGAAPLAQFFAARSAEGLPTIMLQLAPLYILGAAGLFFAVTPIANGSDYAPAPGKGRFTSLLGDAGILSAWGAAATVLFAFVSFHAGVQALAKDIGVDLQTLRLVGLPPLLLTLAAAVMTRRFGPIFTVRVGLLMTALSLGLAIVETPSVLILASVLLSAGVALAIPGLIATIAGRATNANRGLALSIYTFTLFLGASIAAPVAQWVAPFGTIPLWIPPVALLLLATFGLNATSKTRPSPTP